jgi:hypothetical protein
VCGIGGRRRWEIGEVGEGREDGGPPEETFAVPEEVRGDVGGFGEVCAEDLFR